MMIILLAASSMGKHSASTWNGSTKSHFIERVLPDAYFAATLR